MSLLFDLGKWFLAGLATFFAAPLLVSVVGRAYTLPRLARRETGHLPLRLDWWIFNPNGWRDRVSDWYTDLGTAILGRALVEVRGRDLLLHPARYVGDLSMGGVWTAIGDARHVIDPDSMAADWHGAPVLVHYGGRNIGYNLRWSGIAERYDELVRSGQWIDDEDRRKAYFAFRASVGRLTDPAKAVWAIQEDASERLVEEIDRLVELENSWYDSHRKEMIQTIEWITLFGAGAGGVYLLAKLQGTLGPGAGGGGGVTIPLWVGVVPI